MRGNAGGYDQRELLEKYNYMQRRVVEIDRLTMRNIIFVEKVLVMRLRATLLKVEELKGMIEILKKENIDLIESEEIFLGMPNPKEGEMECKDQDTKIKIQELESEKNHLETDLKTFTDQQEAITKRAKCLEEEKERLAEQRRMVGIWSKVADKTKLLGLLEQELEV
jgi:hypothetical protein